MDKKNL